MVVDIFSLVLLAGLVFLGWRSGAFQQVVRLVAIVAVIAGVPFASPLIRRVVFRESGTASPGVEVGSMLVAGVLIYVAIALAGWMAVKVMRFVSTTLSVADRMGGAVIGGAKGTMLIYLFAVLLVMMEGPLSERDPDDRLRLRGGCVTGVATEHNVLAPWQFPDLGRLHTALRVAKSVEAGDEHELVGDDEAVAEFLRDERVDVLVNDEELMEWVRRDHYPLTLADARVRELLNDSEMRDRLEQGDWEGLEEVIAEADDEDE